jgi:hypothetical protein
MPFSKKKKKSGIYESKMFAKVAYWILARAAFRAAASRPSKKKPFSRTLYFQKKKK